jgi:hypothetical protein
MYVLAVVAIGFGPTVARRYRSATARNASWIFASSQATHLAKNSTTG